MTLEDLKNKILNYPKAQGRIYFSGELTQHGYLPAIFNSDAKGEQLKGIDPHGREVLKISAECFSRNLFLSQTNTLESSIKNTSKILEDMGDKLISFRGGSLKEKGELLLSPKSIYVQDLFLMNSKELMSEKAETLIPQKNSDPIKIMQTRFLKAKFKFSLVLDLDNYHPSQCKFLLKLVDEIAKKGLKDQELDSEIKLVDEYLKEHYPIKENSLDVLKIQEVLADLLKNYMHRVHKKYNPVLLVENLVIKKVSSAQEEAQEMDRILQDLKNGV